MKDVRCTVGVHDYPRPGKKHPVSADDIHDSRLTLKCPRCGSTKTVKWIAGPRRDVDPPLDGFFHIEAG